LDDEEMNNRVLRELELVRRAQEQQPQQEQAPRNDPPPPPPPPPVNGTSPIASPGGNNYPIDCFNEFFTPEIIQRICDCTNDRAKRFRVLLKLAETDLATHPQIKEALKRPPWIPAKQSWPPECACAWTDLTPPELKRWVGILVYSGVVDLASGSTSSRQGSHPKRPRKRRART
jgi:hypothetical protein